MNERMRLALLAGDQAQSYLDWLRAIKENPQSEVAWDRLAVVVFQLAGALSELNGHLDEDKEKTS